MLANILCVRDAGVEGSNPFTPTMFPGIIESNLAHYWRTMENFMQHAYNGFLAMLRNYESEHGKPPQVIALGKTHLEDLQNYFEVKTDGVYFEGIEVIQHNDPIGIVMV